MVWIMMILLRSPDTFDNLEQNTEVDTIFWYIQKLNDLYENIYKMH